MLILFKKLKMYDVIQFKASYSEPKVCWWSLRERGQVDVVTATSTHRTTSGGFSRPTIGIRSQSSTPHFWVHGKNILFYVLLVLIFWFSLVAWYKCFWLYSQTVITIMVKTNNGYNVFFFTFLVQSFYINFHSYNCLKVMKDIIVWPESLHFKLVCLYLNRVDRLFAD